MKRMLIGLTAMAIAALPAMAQDRADPARVEAIYKDMFKDAKDDWAKRTVQDETQKICSEHRNTPPNAEADKILEREKQNVKLPADGKFLGDWKSGEQIAQSGFGGRFSDKPTTINGGNCYACHQLTKEELSYGTLGPSLREYGKIRKFAEAEAKAAYVKIYNAQSAVACSNMPRFGHNGFLSETQIKDLVALLFDPASPVNK